MFENIQSQQNRRLFSIIVVGALLTILLLRFIVLPHFTNKAIPFDEIVDTIFGELFSTIIVTASISLFLLWVSMPSHEKKIEIIEPKRILEELSKARHSTNFWYYDGAVARFTRTNTIPELVKKIKETNERMTLKILVLDPRNTKVVSDYCNYRKGLKSAKKFQSWDVNYVKADIYATIHVALESMSENPLLEVEIGLKNNFSIFRYEISSRSIIITMEDPQDPAVLHTSDSSLYSGYKEAFQQAFKQSVKLDSSIEIKSDDQLSVEKIKLNLEKLNIVDSNMDTNVYQYIKEILDKNFNPYG